MPGAPTTAPTVGTTTTTETMNATTNTETTTMTMTTPTTSRALLDDLPCRRHPADLWFAELPHDVERAKALCGGCPVQAACLAEALRRAEPWGVWGGQLVLQGQVVARKRPRGRPRKDEVAA